jgi:Fe2+ or Zn2+ uptake regulation protein
MPAMLDADSLTVLFREQGFRVTPQRQAIFRLLHGDDSHPTVEALHERAAAEMPTISLKTVYQTVHDLEALGQVRVLDLGTGSVRVDPNVDEHHHLVCTACGRVRDVPVTSERARLPAPLRRAFKVDAVEVIFRGRCTDCSRSTTQERSTRWPS